MKVGMSPGSENAHTGHSVQSSVVPPDAVHLAGEDVPLRGGSKTMDPSGRTTLGTNDNAAAMEAEPCASTLAVDQARVSEDMAAAETEPLAVDQARAPEETATVETELHTAVAVDQARVSDDTLAVGREALAAVLVDRARVPEDTAAVETEFHPAVAVDHARVAKDMAAMETEPHVVVAADKAWVSEDTEAVETELHPTVAVDKVSVPEEAADVETEFHATVAVDESLVSKETAAMETEFHTTVAVDKARVSEETTVVETESHATVAVDKARVSEDTAAMETELHATVAVDKSRVPEDTVAMETELHVAATLEAEMDGKAGVSADGASEKTEECKMVEKEMAMETELDHATAATDADTDKKSRVSVESALEKTEEREMAEKDVAAMETEHQVTATTEPEARVSAESAANKAEEGETADGKKREREFPSREGEAAERKVRLKVSSEAGDSVSVSDQRDQRGGGGGHRPPLRRRKIAIFLAYCGAGFQGMQRNPGAVTIEGALEEALFKAGAIPERFRGDPGKSDWTRAARTDKGVSAAGQVVSGLFSIEPPGLVDRVNQHLPEAIRVFGYKRVTPSFSAKNLCDRRRYEYAIPTFAFDPTVHLNPDSVMADEGVEGTMLKCPECLKHGWKLPRLPNKGKKADDESLQGKDESIPKANDGNCFDLDLKRETFEMDPSIDSRSSPEEKPAPVETQHTECLNGSLPEVATLSGDDISLEEEKARPLYQFSEEDRTRMNSILQHYVGTHNFHNFTSRTKAEDPSAKRYIVSFECSDVFSVDGMEFVRCVVVGQSFMLHQIRKMIGLAIAVFRGFASEPVLQRALRRDTRIGLPTAPELGLLLDECLFPAYNKKWQATHEDVSQKEFQGEITEFKHKYIYPHIVSTEAKVGVTAYFLHCLNYRNYPELVALREEEKIKSQKLEC